MFITWKDFSLLMANGILISACAVSTDNVDTWLKSEVHADVGRDASKQAIDEVTLTCWEVVWLPILQISCAEYQIFRLVGLSPGKNSSEGTP